MMHFLFNVAALALVLVKPTEAQYTSSDLAAHSSPGDCWTVVSGNVYDVTSYAGSHPGGSGLVHQMCGKDATSSFNGQHGGKNYMRTLTAYKGTFSGTAPSAPPPSETGGFCFSAVATVQVYGKGAVAMQNLKIGDHILTGNQKYERIYGFGHYHTGMPAKFLQIYTEDKDAPLEMTAEHMVFVAGKTNPVRADSVQVGDALQSDGVGQRVVKKVRSVIRKGLYAPLTPDGTVMVDGIKASSYIVLQDRDEEYMELQHGIKPMSQHDGIHLVLTPFRMICRAYSADFCQDYNEEGMPKYVVSGIKLLKWLDSLDMNIVVQACLFVIALVIFVVLRAFEVLLFDHGTDLALVVVFFFQLFIIKNARGRNPKKVA